MGTNNRQRRKAKQKTRQQRERTRAQFAQAAVEIDELLEDAVHTALHARHTGQEKLLTESVAWLASPTGDGLVDAVLQEMMCSAVTSAWKTGWQPADLICAGRRRFDARAERMLVDMISAEMREYATATVDERFQAQLATLSADVWWQRDDDYLAAWSHRHNVDRHQAIQVLIDVLYFLELLPELPLLGPPPGAARRGSLAPPDRDVDTRLLDRVRALLAKAESTDFPEEADAYTSKAQELMARYSIDYALLATRQGSRQEPEGRRVAIDNPYEAQKASLLDVVAQANQCRAIWSRELGFSTVLGYQRDVAATEMLFTSLLVQAVAALRHAGSQADGRTTSFRRSFLTAYAHQIGQRLGKATDNAREAAVHDYGGELLPVLASRTDAVEAEFERLFPKRSYTQATAPTNRLGWMAGRAAADRADLGGNAQALGAPAR